MDALKATLYPIDTGVLSLELFLRLSLILVYAYCRCLEPNYLSVASLQNFEAHGYPYANPPLISSRLLYKLVLTVIVLGGVAGALYARASLRPEPRLLFTSLIYYGLASSLALVITAAATNVLKTLTGRMRPDYLARCLPSHFRASNWPHTSLTAISAALQDGRLQCELDSPYDVLDGRRSFPSGHSSYSAAVASVAALYWLQILRRASPSRPALHAGLGAFVVSLYAVFPVIVGTTRVLDRRHHPSDVVAGLLLGAVNGIVCGRLYFREALAIPQKTKELPSSPMRPLWAA